MVLTLSLKRLARIARSLWFLCALTSSNYSFGHSGSLDKDKCHIESISSDYHCHISNPNVTSLAREPRLSPQFDRSEYGFRSRGSKEATGYYSEVLCSDAESDHVVALADAHASGAANWKTKSKEDFANDPENLVWACPSANRSKGSSGPADYLRKNSDGLGVDGTLKDVCKFALHYLHIKAKYKLEVSIEDDKIIADCKGGLGR